MMSRFYSIVAFIRFLRIVFFVYFFNEPLGGRTVLTPDERAGKNCPLQCSNSIIVSQQPRVDNASLRRQ